MGGDMWSQIPKNLKSFLHFHQSPNPKFPNSSRRSLSSSPAAISHHRQAAAIFYHIPASLGQNYLTLVSTAPTIVIVHTTSSAAGRQVLSLKKFDTSSESKHRNVS
ncbi:hypothetical protein HanPSC8_Chr04g0137081 [Helianthus annuus]|nr:hypothetical protein HanPSC8_Chr04g0137081 [Helianthus annuus]